MPKKPMTEVQKQTRAEQDRMNKNWFARMGDQVGQELVADLKQKFDVRSPLKRDTDGRVDVHQTLANCGAYEVLSYIDQRIRMGSPDKQRN